MIPSLPARLIIATATLILLVGCTGSDLPPEPEPLDPPPRVSQRLAADSSLSGRLLDLQGQPVTGATLSLAHGHPDQAPVTATSAADGSFLLTDLVPAPCLLRVAAAGHYPEYLVAAADGTTVLGDCTLVPRTNGRVRLLLAGDTMFGRRFEDGDEDGIPGEADDLIDPLDRAATATALFDDIAMVMDGVDYRVVNFESPASTAWESRHPFKEYSFSSHPDTLVALQALGIDAVSLGNNHSFDLLEAGRQETEAALTTAGIGWCGSGASDSDARANLLVATANGVGLRLQGFNGIRPSSWYPDPDRAWDPAYWYYALDDPMKGGALLLSNATIDDFFTRTLGSGALRLPMLHGGHEYGEYPSPFMRSMFERCATAGATLVKAHHSHTVYGMLLAGSEDDPCLIAASLGNFCFDQLVFETFNSYLALVTLDHVAGDDFRIAHARLLPFHAEDYRPRLIAGAQAARLGRHVGHLSTWLPELPDDDLRGAWVFPEPGGIAVIPRPEERTVADRHDELVLTIDNGSSAVQELVRDDPADFLAGLESDTPGSFLLGRDRLIYGDFEDHDIDATVGENTVWWQTDNVYPSPAAARSGRIGMLLFRQRDTRSSVHTNLRNRITFVDGARLSLHLHLRGANAGPWQLTVEWLRRDSQRRLREDILIDDPGGDFPWRAVGRDLDPPPGAGHLRLRLDMAPPLDDAGGHLATDDWRLIDWETSATPGAAIATPNDVGYWRFVANDPAATEARCTIAWQRYRRQHQPVVVTGR